MDEKGNRIDPDYERKSRPADFQPSNCTLAISASQLGYYERLPRRQLLGELFELSALIGSQDLDNPVPAGGADIFDLRLQIVVIFHEIIQNQSQPVGLIWGQAEFFTQRL